MENGRTGGVVAVVLVGVVCWAAAGAAVAGAATVDSTVVDDTASVPPANNTTAHHVNPDDVDASGDAESVERWLAGRLAEQLANGTVHLSQGEYELADRSLGERYRDRFGQYVDVAGETDEENAVASFKRARANQKRYTDAVRSYRETHEEYRLAKRNGNETKARRLARELERLSQTVNETGSTLRRQYDAISQTTGAETAASGRRVRNVTATIANTQASIREQEFERTQLRVQTATERASFRDPLVVTGRLLGEDGMAVETRRAAFHIGGRTIRTDVGEDGVFELRFRPTTLPLRTDALSVRYVPAASSDHFGSNATLPVTVVQVEPTVAVDDVRRTIRFGDGVTITGTVRADNLTAPGVPVRVSLGDERLDTVVTDENGTFAVRAAVPATVATGNRTVRATVPLDGRALASANGTSTVAVRETRTALTVTASSDARTLDASGRLVTADGTPIPNRLVHLRMSGKPIATVRTDGDGRYAASVDAPPARKRGNETVVVTAAFSGKGTSLAADRATATVDPADTGPQAGGGGPIDTARDAPWVIPAVVVVVAGLGIWFARRRFGGNDPGATDGRAEPPTAERSAEEERPSLPTDAVADEADDRPDRAVALGYAAVRRRLNETHDLSRTLTHWEAYSACLDEGLDDDRQAALGRLTETYERAAFAPERVSTAEATDAADAMRTFESAADS